MLTKLNDLRDVEEFIHTLVEEGVNCHPDTDFEDYVHMETGEPTFNEEEAALRNRLMNEAFDICEQENTDLYSLMQEIFLIDTGLDKYIPLPSQVISDSDDGAGI
ncbi:MAG TPA: hypothetical protein VGN20_14060 [Mucilaginibacter sp.]